jgi:hypothetical protein
MFLLIRYRYLVPVYISRFLTQDVFRKSFRSLVVSGRYLYFAGYRYRYSTGTVAGTGRYRYLNGIYYLQIEIPVSRCSSSRPHNIPVPVTSYLSLLHTVPVLYRDLRIFFTAK